MHDTGIEFDLADQVRDSTGADAVILERVLNQFDSRNGGIHCITTVTQNIDRSLNSNSRVRTADYNTCHPYMLLSRQSGGGYDVVTQRTVRHFGVEREIGSLRDEVIEDAQNLVVAGDVPGVASIMGMVDLTVWPDNDDRWHPPKLEELELLAK
jgi:hypothetical protein